MSLPRRLPEQRSGDELPFVSVVMPVRNEAKHIDASLSALLSQTYPFDRLEIIVADGRSTDGTGEIVRRRAQIDPRIRLIENPAAVTPAGLNAAIRAAQGDIIAWMSGHAEAEPEYIERGVRLLSETGAWSVGARIARTATTPEQRAVALATASPFGVGDAVHNYASEGRWVDTVFPGMWPRTVFETVGLFDEELVRNQDDEHAFRIREAGGRIWYDPQLVVRYVPRTGPRGLFEQYRQYAFWKVKVFQKHPRAARWRHFVPATFVLTVAAGAVSGPWFRPGAVAALASLITYIAAMTIGTIRMDTTGTSRGRVLAALAAMHVGYGLGMWQGLARLARSTVSRSMRVYRPRSDGH